MKKVEILDSTLRDGAQGIGISYSVEDKLQIVKLLDELGVQLIEAGHPASNPKELAFFEKANLLRLRTAELAAFGSTRRKQCRAEEDHALRALLHANTRWCTIFGKSWKLHVDKVLETTYEENLLMIQDSVRFLKQNGRMVIYDAEHFFDGYRDDPEYALQTLRAAAAGGADTICLCDTNGGSFLQTILPAVDRVREEIEVPLGVHFHNDSGMAVASSIESVLHGAVQVQGTLLGFGERCGNANLSTIIPGLQLKNGYHCIPEENIKSLTRISRAVAEITNVSVAHGMPYIGKNAFAHKAGMHADGVIKLPPSFEHIDPVQVGNVRRFPTSEISGKSIILEKIQQLFPERNIELQDVTEVLTEIKRLELEGYQFEGADASFELLVRKKMEAFEPFFKLIYYHIGTDLMGDYIGASATVKLEVEGQIQLMAAEGNGPVHALDAALRKALEVFFPALSEVKLTDYKVRVLDSQNATASRVRVLITSKYGQTSYTTVGVSGDVVAASWKALEDSMEYFLLGRE